ncbi:acetate uptake transporter [Trebonia sp.]|uniref:acetate uptake transporter n=1 Tax=Trebonia sp. TaxID=2767075 RepID=UPI00262C8784|nr:acetate uptake transporter [Trebonia sp.]
MTTSDAITEQASTPTPAKAGMANPAPWAVTAFATTSFMLGMYQTGLLNSAGVPIVLPAAFFFGGLVQIIVAVLEFSRGNLFAGSVFGTYGPFWVIFAAFETLYAASVPAAQLSSATSLFLAVFAVITFYLAVASLRTDLVLAIILWLIFVGLVLLSIGAGASSSGVTKAGGWVVLVFAVLAWYHAAGDIIESTFGRKVLPFGPPPLR